MTIELPYPPSVNHYWRRVGPRTIISRAGRAYRKAVAAEVLACGRPHVSGRIAVMLDVYPPDKRRRDLDNLPKAVLDALEAAGVYENDSQIDELGICRREVYPGGKLWVEIEELAR